jgi:hypothetical protein
MLLVWNCLENLIPIQWCAELLNCFVHIFMYGPALPLALVWCLLFCCIRHHHADRLGNLYLQVLLLSHGEPQEGDLVEEVHHSPPDRPVRPRQLSPLRLVRSLFFLGSLSLLCSIRLLTTIIIVPHDSIAWHYLWKGNCPSFDDTWGHQIGLGIINSYLLLFVQFYFSSYKSKKQRD